MILTGKLVRFGALAVAVAAPLFLPRLCQAADLYADNVSTGAVDVYDATTGQPAQSPIAGGDASGNLAASGGDLFVLNSADGVSEYDATTGATVNASLISGLSYPSAIAVSGGDIFIASLNGDISEYTTSAPREFRPHLLP